MVSLAKYILIDREKLLFINLYLAILAGKANCGKNWFFDMVCAYYINVGLCANYVRGQNFPFNDCVSRRILMWNEPSIMNSAMDTVKMLTAGDPLSVAVKYQSNGTINRTPIIFLSNKIIFPTSAVWESRMFVEHWNPCPYLANLRKYPHPLTYYHLIKKYI